MVVIVEASALEKIVYRHQLAKARVLMVREVTATGSMLCYSSDFNLVLARLTKNGADIMQEIQMQRELSELLVYENQFLAVFTSGDSEMFWIREE